MIHLLWAFACTRYGPGKPCPEPKDPPPLDPTLDTDISSDTESESDTETELPDPCEVDEALEVKSVTASQPWHANELLVEVELSAPAAVAVTCTLRDDPSEVHLAEALEPATTHALRLSGLLAASDYDCVAAATCPSSSEPASCTVTTGEPPPGLPGLEISALDGAGSEYVLFNQSQDCDYQFGRLNVVDRQGRYRWWYHTPPWVGPSVEFRYHGDDQFAWGGGWGPNALGRPRQVDLYEGERYDSAQALPDVESSLFHHDGKQLPDGRLLTLEEVWVEGPDEDFQGFRVRRLDPATGTVDFDYHSQRALDEGHLPQGEGDAWHANWADIVDETLYVSLCNLALVVAIDVATGDWLWSFGEGGDFEVLDADGEPLGSEGFTECQHGLEITPDGRLLVYDNGLDRAYSRVSEYQLDPATHTATMLWTWTEDDWWETTLGDADYLPGGRVLVGAGHSDCFSSNPGDRTTILEIDPASGEKLWQLRYVERGLTAYRADWADPCDLFSNAAYCSAVRERLDQLSPVLTP